jgi:hypothetical protein
MNREELAPEQQEKLKNCKTPEDIPGNRQG